MSNETPARDGLVQVVSMWFDLDEEHPQVQGYADAFAHELAQQQRQKLKDDGYDTDCRCMGCSSCLATEYIDLIDPQAQQ